MRDLSLKLTKNVAIIAALFGLISNAITIYVYSRPQMRTPINCILIGNKGLTIAFLIINYQKRLYTVTEKLPPINLCFRLVMTVDC